MRPKTIIAFAELHAVHLPHPASTARHAEIVDIKLPASARQGSRESPAGPAHYLPKVTLIPSQTAPTMTVIAALKV